MKKILPLAAALTLLLIGFLWYQERRDYSATLAEARRLRGEVVRLQVERQHLQGKISGLRDSVKLADARRPKMPARPRLPDPPPISITPSGDSLISLRSHREIVSGWRIFSDSLLLVIAADSSRLAVRDSLIIALTKSDSLSQKGLEFSQREADRWKEAFERSRCRILPGVPCPPWWVIAGIGVAAGVYLPPGRR